MGIVNFFKTWNILAPEECQQQFEDHSNYLPEKPKEGSFTIVDPSIPPYELHLLDERYAMDFDSLYGTIQRCIMARSNFRGWELRNDFDGCSAKVYGYTENRYWEYNNPILQQYKSKEIVFPLFISYLWALAGLRPVTSGKWQCINGDVVDVVGVAEPIDPSSNQHTLGLYELDNAPGQTVYLLENGKFSTSYWDYQRRVFYSCNGKKIAQSVCGFLGLVPGIEDAENEGLLKFWKIEE